ncbi:hypothetical protein [Achromobacter marplatensis]|uniref:hypothetical protein n=1 Tax=Achromobacter marplatensis TaxID=470868 RepID=UPI0039F72194
MNWKDGVGALCTRVYPDHSARHIASGHAAPELGQHTDDVLRDRLGLSVSRIAELKARGVV